MIFPDAANAGLTNTDLKKIENAIDKIIAKQNPFQMERYEKLA